MLSHEARREKRRVYYLENREAKLAYSKARYVENREAKLAYSKARYVENREAVLLYQKARYSQNKERFKEQREANKEVRKTRYLRDREKYRPVQAAYARKKRKASISFKLRGVLAIRILTAFRKKYKKAASTEKLLGASVAFVRGYLEAKFLPGMSWKNHGTHGWHIDHIRPCASFDLSDPEQQKLCFHYTNLQPLWAKDNLKKGDKMV